MRRLVAATIVCVVTLTPGVAGAAHSHGGKSRRDRVVGAGWNQFLYAIGEARFSFAATSDPLGRRPSGHAASDGDPDGPGPVGPFAASGEVTCLRVSGARASFKWRFARAAGSAEPLRGGGVQAFLEDNGRPRAGTPVDRAGLDAPQPAATFDLAATRCDDPNLFPGYDRIEGGDIRIHDAAPRRAAAGRGHAPAR